MKIEIELTEFEYSKLQRLAENRLADIRKTNSSVQSYTVQDCIKAFARTCQPGGSGWRPPWESVKK